MFPSELDRAAEVLFTRELAARDELAKMPAYFLNKLTWVLHRTFQHQHPKYPYILIQPKELLKIFICRYIYYDHL